MEDSGYIVNYIDNFGTPPVSQLQCPADANFDHCYEDLTPQQILADPSCDGSCPAGAVTKSSGAVTFNPALNDVGARPDAFFMQSKSFARKLERVDSTGSSDNAASENFSWLWIDWDALDLCTAWNGGDKALAIHNSGQHNALLVDCLRSDVQVSYALTGDCCGYIFGVRSPNAPLKLTVTGDGYMHVQLTRDSSIAKGVEVSLSGEKSSMKITANPGKNTKIKVFGSGTPGGPPIEIATCPPGSAAGSPAIECNVTGRTCKRVALHSQEVIDQCSSGVPPISGRKLLGASPAQPVNPDLDARRPLAETLATCPHMS